jgi:polar amino acid transport system permease protein
VTSLQDLAPYLPQYLRGIATTALITSLSIAVMLSSAAVLGVARAAGTRATRRASTVVIETLRGNSAVVLLFWVFFALPTMPGNVQLSGEIASVLALGLTGGAYAAEVVRSGIEAVPGGQWQACRALGLGWRRMMRRIILPQAVPLMVPSLTALSVEMLKWSAVVSFVTVKDIVFWAETARTATGRSIVIYVIVLLTYLLLAWVIGLLGRRVEVITTPARQSRTRGVAPEREQDEPIVVKADLPTGAL